MKKILLLTVALLTLCCANVSAKVGDVVGEAYNTDIVAYINHYAIPSYAVNGTSCIVAEDLRNFCFDVSWDNATRSLNISRTGETKPTQINFMKRGTASSKFADILETDISVYAGGVKLTSYAINGYTMIPIEELTMFGECMWVGEERAIKLWVDGIDMRSEKQVIHNEDMMDVYAAVLLRQYRAKMKDPSSFKLNAVYAGYDSSIYSGYDFVLVADVSGKNSYGGITRSVYTMLLQIDTGKYILDLKDYADDCADAAWGGSKIAWMDVAQKALSVQINAQKNLRPLDINMITRLVLSV